MSRRSILPAIMSLVALLVCGVFVKEVERTAKAAERMEANMREAGAALLAFPFDEAGEVPAGREREFDDLLRRVKRGSQVATMKTHRNIEIAIASAAFLAALTLGFTALRQRSAAASDTTPAKRGCHSPSAI